MNDGNKSHSASPIEAGHSGRNFAMAVGQVVVLDIAAEFGGELVGKPLPVYVAAAIGGTAYAFYHRMQNR